MPLYTVRLISNSTYAPPPRRLGQNRDEHKERNKERLQIETPLAFLEKLGSKKAYQFMVLIESKSPRFIP
jgi:hypothetical protein